MKEILKYRGKAIFEKDIEIIRAIIAENPDKSRRYISQEVCRRFEWRQANGTLKDMVCRSLLLLLESKGLIKQPARKQNPPNPLANRKSPDKVDIDTSPIKCSLEELYPIILKQVRRTEFEKLFNSLINEYHYLGYTQPVGEHLKYIAFSQERPIACLAWSSAPWFIGDRDRFIGWGPETRKTNLHLIANNTRFLILPWVDVSCLGSYLLALNRKMLSQDWVRLYHHPLYLVETFVDKSKFVGVVYRADNWNCIGETTGLGKLSKTLKPILPKKTIYVYPLNRNFRKKLNTID
jgi:hypothetical protein